MCTSYNTKRAFRAINHSLLKELLAKEAPELTVDWNKVGVRNVDVLYTEFLKLDDDHRAIVDSSLFEICAFSDLPANAQTLHNLIHQQGLTPPEGFEEWTVHDKATWVFLKNEAAWTQAARFAHVDRMTATLWFTQKLYNGGAGKLDYQDEQFERLEKEVSAYIYAQEGRGKYCHHEYFERIAQNKECFFIYLSDYPRNTMQWKGGADFTRGIDKAAYEIVIVYDRKENILSLRTTGCKAHKVRLCRIWAKVMRDTVISDADAKKSAYDIDGFKNGPELLTIDPMSDVEEAKVLELETRISGNKGSRRVFQENDRDLFTQMRDELNPDKFPMALMEISYVKIRLGLNPKKYGRSKTQTVIVKPDHCDINSKDPRVQTLIMETLKGWKICA